MLTEENQHNWKKIIMVMPLFALIIFGYSLSQIAANVLFVKRVGSEFLPYTYVVNAILGTVISLIAASTASKHSIARYVQLLSLISALVLTGVMFMVNANMIWAYPIFLVFTQLVYAVLGGLLMWDVGMKICGPIEGKWAFGYFSLGASLGGIAAGALSSFVGENYGTELLIPVIIASLVLLFINSIIVQFHFADNFKPDNTVVGQSAWQTLKEGFLYYRKSKIAKMLSTILVLFYSVKLIGDYEFQKILGDSLSEGHFAVISGYVSIAENALLIVVFLFAQKWILSKLGVLKTFSSSPILVLIPFVMLFFYPIYILAIGAKVLIKMVNYSTFSSSIRLILTSIPHKVRSSVSTFVGGNSESGATLLAGTALIFLTKYLANSWIVGLGIALLAVIIFMAFILRREYINQIVKNLSSDDIDDVHTAIENLAEPAYKKLGVQELMQMIERENLAIETVRKIIFALGKIDNINVIPGLLDIFDRYDITVKYAAIDAIHGFSDLSERLNEVPFTRLNLIETYQRIFLEEEDPDLKIFILKHLKDFDPDHVITFLKDAVKHPNPQIQYQAIKAMKYFNDRGIVRYIRPFLMDKSVMIRASAVIVLWQFMELRPQLLKEFIKMNSSKEKEYILAAFFIISKLELHWESRTVEGYLNNADLQIKTMAALTLMEIDDFMGMNIYVDTLISENDFSVTMARNIKDLSVNVKNALLINVKNRGAQAVQVCVANMQKTYLNYSKEIEFLTNQKTGISPFAGSFSFSRIVKTVRPPA